MKMNLNARPLFLLFSVIVGVLGWVVLFPHQFDDVSSVFVEVTTTKKRVVKILQMLKVNILLFII
jgi:hypothetical protein